MSEEKTKEVSTDLPVDVDFVSTKYEVTHSVVTVGDELQLFDDEKIIHTEIQEGSLSIWMLKNVGRSAFVAEEVDHE